MVPHLNYEHLNYQQLPDAHHTSKVLTEIMDTTVNLKPTGTIMLQLQQSPSEYYEKHTISTAYKAWFTI